MKKFLSLIAILGCFLPALRAQLVERESVKGQVRIGSGLNVNLNFVTVRNFNQIGSAVALSPGIQYFPGERIQLAASVPLSYSRSLASVNQALINQRTQSASGGVRVSAGYYHPIGDRLFALARVNMEGRFQWWSINATPQTGFTPESNSQFFLTPSLSFHLGFRAWEGAYIETSVASLFTDSIVNRLRAPDPITPLQFSFSPIASGIALYFSKF